MEWYEELDFDENPFTLETKYVGNDDVLEEAFYSVVAGSILIVEGDDGSGKTKLLKEVARRFGGHGKVAFVDAKALERELNIEDIIAKKNGLLGYVFKKYPKGMILLLDNVEHLSQKNLERIKYFFDRNHLRAVVIATKDYTKLNFPESLQQRVWKHIRLKSLTEYEAVQVFRDKVGAEILSDRVIKETYRQSEKNLRRFFVNSERVCKAYLANKNLTEDDVKNMLAREAT